MLLYTNLFFAQTAPPRLSVDGDAEIKEAIFVGQLPPAAPPVDPDCGTPAFTGPDCLPIVKANIYDDVLIYGRLLLRDENSNIIIGKEAAKENTTAKENIAIGLSALFGNTSKSHLIAIGDSALYNNGVDPTGGIIPDTAAVSNIAIGSRTLFANTLGAKNIAIGRFALTSNTNGFCNVATGKDALKDNTSGNTNIAYGCEALFRNKTGDGNTAIGHEALRLSQSGDFNTALGYRAFEGGSGFTNSTAIGAFANILGSNSIILGNSAVSVIQGNVNFSTFSDRRLKQNIQDNIPGLSFINRLRPVSYQMNVDAMMKDYEGTTNQFYWQKVAEEKGKIRYTGFVAQEVAVAAKKVDFDFSGVLAPRTEEDHYALRYAEFVVPLVKAVQELSEENEKKAEQIRELEARLAKIETLLKDRSNVEINAAQLEQNTPNPFTESTQIRYFLPENTTNASLQIVDMNGRIKKTILLEHRGFGQLNLQARSLHAGMHTYRLIVDGKIAVTRQMLITNQ